jgi:putative SOS response-associated peptidase YedK
MEWKKLAPKEKQPYAIALAGGGFMALAGLWENCRRPKHRRGRPGTSAMNQNQLTGG